MVNFYSTLDNGRLHIADANSRYGGNINSYNNFLTRFFSKIFGKMIQVDFQGKMRALNKKSYMKLLQANGFEANKNNIRDFVDFDQVMRHKTRDWGTNNHMRDHLSHNKSQKLFKKMVHAISDGNVAKAQILAGKGANLEQNFWERNHYGISFQEVTFLIPEAALKFNATRYNPILYAAKNGYRELVQFLKRIGSSTNCKGETIKVKRSFSHIENQYHVSHHATHVYGGYRHPHYVVYHPRVHRETIVHFQDKQKVLSRHFLNENLNYMTEAVQN